MTTALTRNALDAMRCDSDGSDGTMHLHSACHPGGGVDAAYFDGKLTIICHVCNAAVAQVEVAGETPTVVCVRHPDHSNGFTMFGGVTIHDVDYGRSNLADPDEYAEWAQSWGTEIAQLRERGAHAIADCVAEAVRDGEGVR